MEDKYPTNLFKENHRLMRIAGLWFPKKENNYRKWLICTIQTSIYLLNCEIYFYFSEMSEVRHTYKNKKMFLEHLGKIILHTLTSTKVLNFCFRRNRAFNIIKTLESEEFRYRATDDFKPGLYFQEAKKFIFKMSWSYIMLTTVVPMAHFVSTVYGFAVKYTAEDFLQGNVTCHDVSPYYMVMPFPVGTKLSCGFGLMYEFIVIMWYSWQIAAHDTLLAAILIYIRTHFKAVRGAFASIKLRSEMELGLLDTKKKNDKDNAEVTHQMDLEMTKCTKHMETIIEVCDSAESMFNIVALGQTLNTLFILVSCLFLLSSWNIVSLKFAAQLLYLLGLLYQLSLYCWFGNEVMLAGLTVPDYIYHSDWLDASASYKRSMLINMIRMKRPIVFTAGKFTTLTLATLVTIIRGSYSYFAVLKNMDAAASAT
ncbi:hypothetical protein ILUMI_04601 [Ignelater luminosus]|uniref:Odorant receptor n=1 Tax=Ignelater luminosus TaxID=2038154 RepID=A0A8K0GL03_IGNLU|nr:hypothetical protein ILUMI_04601 [Ignelater luminosus]